MRDYAIVIGGLESIYMRKLALRLKERLDSRVRVGIVEKDGAYERPEDQDLTVWVGSEEFVNAMSGSETAKNRIILDDDEGEDEVHVFRYQSAERLYRAIRQRCRQIGYYPAAGVKNRRQRWVAVTTDGSAGVLEAFSMICAQILGDVERALYLGLSACGGMERLFCLESETDLSDLILELRKNEDATVEEYAGRIGRADYLLPPANPMILHEMDGEDLARLLSAVRRSGKYDSVVFAVGTAVCGCEQIFAASGRIIHLTGRGLVSECARGAWLDFIRRCEAEEGAIRQVPEPELTAEVPGEHLIDDWLEEPVGRLAMSCLEEKEDEDDETLAGDPGQAVW